MKKIMLIEAPMLGSDPEVFAFDKTIGMIVPSLDLVGGTKTDPRPLSEAGYFVQEDNVLLEYNIPPATTKQEFVTYIHRGLELLQNLLPKGFEPLIRSSYTFTPSALNDPRAQEMGCNPDMNAWTGAINPRPDLEKTPYLRSSGGHVILGYKKPDVKLNPRIIKLMDAMLGVPSVILDPDKDRRKLYGKAGAYRDKDFGVEYRTLSSFWLGSQELTGWIYDQTMKVVDLVNNNNFEMIKHEDLIINTINNADVESAKLFVDQYCITMPNTAY